ncbi:hypothetical protein AUI07_06240 [archaeon 13_2_20CM_2_53_6]|nr:MAG: hypothetical protein AUI07_06240 [archaeon 13_2_20CM_2_53_6]
MTRATVDLFPDGTQKKSCRSIRYIRSRKGFFERIGMTRPDWQKKRKKMSGREGPKKGKVR